MPPNHEGKRLAEHSILGRYASWGFLSLVNWCRMVTWFGYADTAQYVAKRNLSREFSSINTLLMCATAGGYHNQITTWRT